MDSGMYIERNAKKHLHQYLEAFPAVTLTGPRQSGKSTLVQHELPHFEYVNLDHTPHLLYLKEDPQGFIKRFNQNIIFDEVQKVPELFPLLKVAIDQERTHRGRFILTGSNQLNRNHHISESLAGRTGIMSLLPFGYSELPEAMRSQMEYRGGYPEVVVSQYQHADLWFQSYIETYLSKDVRTLVNIGDLSQFHRFLRLLASRTAQLLVYSDLAKAIGVSVPTIKRWLSLLEASYIVFTLPPYYKNFGKRIIKSPKVYFYDTGLVSHLTGIQTPDHYHYGPMAGAIFENFIISETRKHIHHTGMPASLYFLRTSNQVEVDLVIESGQRLIMAEIKKSATFSTRFLTHVQNLTQQEPTAEGLLIYQGEPMQTHEPNLRVIPASDYLTHFWQL